MKEDLKQVFDEYIDERRLVTNLRSETIRGYKAVFSNFCGLMPEIRTVELITTEKMVEFFKRLQNRKRIVGKGIEKVGVKASTVKTYWSKLNSFFEWLYKRDYIKTNPLSTLKPPEVEYNDKRALPGKDIHRLISAITTQYKNALLFMRNLVIVDLFVLCGLRKGELLGLQVRDIDLVRRVLTVRGETSKSKHDRQIPIHKTLEIHLQDYFDARKKYGYKTECLIVSANGDRGLTSHGLKHWVERFNKLSGVKFHLHQLRHTFACNLARSGVGVINLQRLMGHTDPRMTQRYLRSMTVEDLRGDIDKLTIDNLI